MSLWLRAELWACGSQGQGSQRGVQDTFQSLIWWVHFVRRGSLKKGELTWMWKHNGQDFHLLSVIVGWLSEIFILEVQQMSPETRQAWMLINRNHKWHSEDRKGHEAWVHFFSNVEWPSPLLAIWVGWPSTCSRAMPRQELEEAWVKGLHKTS